MGDGLQQDSIQYEESLQDYWRVIRSRIGYIVIIILVSLLASYIYSMSEKPVYKATTQIKIDERRQFSEIFESLISSGTGDPIETETKVINSFSVVKEVARELKYITSRKNTAPIENNKLNSFFNAEKQDDLTREEQEIVLVLKAKINPERVSGTNLINITVTELEANKAIVIANTTAEVYAKFNTNNKTKSITNIQKLAAEQAAKHAKELEQTKEKLKEFYNKFPQALQDKFISRKIEEDPLIIRYNQIISELEMEQKKLAKEYTPKHPKMIALQEDLDDKLNKRSQEQVNVASRLNRTSIIKSPSMEIIVKTMENLQEQNLKESNKYKRQLTELEIQKQYRKLMEEVEKQSGNTNTSWQMEHDKLLSEKALLYGFYEMFKTKETQAKIMLAEITSDVMITEPAIGTVTIGTNQNRNLVLGLLLGVVLGIICAFIVEAFDTSIGTIEEVEKHLNLSVLGVVPHIQNPTGDKAPSKEFMSRLDPSVAKLILWQASNAVYVEAYRILQANLQFAAFDHGKKVIMFTSTEFGEGKSLTASNFAIVQAQMGKKVLLLDCDFRRPKIWRMFGLENDTGLSEMVVQGDTAAIHSITDVVVGLGIDDLNRVHGLENLFIVTSGSLVTNPPLTFTSEKMAELMNKFRESYDIIILDCTPTLPVSDALLLAQVADCGVIVYEAGRVSRAALRRVKDLVLNAGLDIVGIVLNNMKASEIKSRLGYYGYESKYYTEPLK